MKIMLFRSKLQMQISNELTSLCYKEIMNTTKHSLSYNLHLYNITSVMFQKHLHRLRVLLGLRIYNFPIRTNHTSNSKTTPFHSSLKTKETLPIMKFSRNLNLKKTTCAFLETILHQVKRFRTPKTCLES